jgi:glycosyltransferase involved in cell wall biosynthesis
MLRGIKHGCYRDSRPITAAVVAMLRLHELAGTWNKKIAAYIALTNFARNKFADNGLPRGKIHVKPNFVDPDPGEREGIGDHAVFLGRLTAEKGLSVLLEAWTRLELSIPLKIAGDGPLRAELEACAKGRGLTDVQFLGRLGRSEAIETIKRARFLVLPSLWYEGFPMVLVESFACGVPVLASRLGAMEELVQHGRVGLHFTPGEPSDLAAKATWAWEHPLEMAAMGREARQTYETQYGAEANYQLLMGIYNSVVHSAIQTNGSLAGELLGVGQ